MSADVILDLWQMSLGTSLLLTILFLPEGLGSLVARLRRRGGAAT
jgi:branched-chain amino acid transport system permease protein